MGYYKQLEITQQDDVDRLVAWYRASGSNLPEYLREWLLERDERVWGAIQRWETNPVPPKRAELHVALEQQTRRSLREAKSKPTTITMTRDEYRMLLFALVAFGLLCISAVVWLGWVL